MEIRRIKLGLLAIAALISMPVALSGMSLNDYKTIYDKEMNSINGKYDTKIRSMDDSYKKSLEMAEKELMNKGDLDGVVAIQTEIKRYSAENNVPPAPDKNAHSLVNTIQKKYIDAKNFAESEKRKSSLILLKKYTSILEEMKVKLVQTDKLDEAFVVGEELKKAENKLKELADSTPKKKAPPPPVKEKPPVVRQPPTLPRRTITRTNLPSKPFKDGGIPETLQDNLILFYKFDNAGDKVPDESGNGNDGTSYKADFGRAYGCIGSGASLKQKASGAAENAYIDMPDDIGKLMTKNSDFTIAYWVKRRSLPVSEKYKRQEQYDIIFHHGTCVSMKCESKKKELVFSVSKGKDQTDEIRADTSTGEWEFWTGTHSASGLMSLYKDGNNVGKTSVKIPTYMNPKQNNRIGWKTWTPDISQSHPDHCIDEVMIFNSCLSATEVRTLYSTMR